MIYLLFLNFAAPLHQHQLCKSYPIVLHCKKLWLDRRYSQSLTRIFHNVIHCCRKGLKFCVLKQNLKMQIPRFLSFVCKMTLCWTLLDFECRHTKIRIIQGSINFCHSGTDFVLFYIHIRLGISSNTTLQSYTTKHLCWFVCRWFHLVMQ